MDHTILWTCRSLLTAETAIDFGVDPEREEQRSIQVAATLGLFSGLVILFMGKQGDKIVSKYTFISVSTYLGSGLARAGHLASFFSRPVLKGFTTGVGKTVPFLSNSATIGYQHFMSFSEVGLQPSSLHLLNLTNYLG